MSDQKQMFLNNKRTRNEEYDANLSSGNPSKDKMQANPKPQVAKPNSRILLEKILEDTEKKESRDKDRDRRKYYADRDYDRDRYREREREREREKRDRERDKEREKERERERDKYRESSRSSSDRKEAKYKDDYHESKEKDKYKEESRDKSKKEKDKKEDTKLKDTKSRKASTSVSSGLKSKFIEEDLVEGAKKGKFYLDEQGRLLDEKGNIVQIKPQMQSTLKININKEKEQRVKELLNTKKIDQFEAQKAKGFKFFDPNLENKQNKREKMRLNAFKFSEMENKLNDVTAMANKNAPTIIPEKNSDLKIIIENHIKQQEELNKEKGAGANEQPTHRTRYLNRLGGANAKQPVKFRAEDLIPDVEWWDTFYLPAGKKSFSPYWYNDEDGNFIHNVPEKINLEDFKVSENDFLNEKITIYVQHPVQIKNEYIEKQNKITMPVFLTEKERKRIRRLRRQEKEKDKQERIRLGLQKPDEPKLKFSNFMNILADSAVQDPSQIERKVRKAYEERYKKMMMENEKNKLTKEQKAEKVRKKFEKDIKKDCKACLFKITNLSDRKNKFKIDKNAQQLYLTGVCITNKRNNVEKIPSFVYVEGGPLALKKFKILLLRRIKWGNNNNANNSQNNNENSNNRTIMLNDNDIMLNEDLNEDKNENNGASSKNDQELKNSQHCMLVWEGTIKKRSFEKWKLMEVTSEIRARKILSDKGMEHYWNLLLSYNYEDE